MDIDSSKNKENAILKRELKKYLWHNIMLLDHSKREKERLCPYCKEWIKSKDVLFHFWSAHKDIYIKYRLLLSKK